MSPDAAGAGLPADRDAAVSALFEAHYPRLVRLARHLLDEPAQAEDIVMDAFVTLSRRWLSVREPEASFGYLHAAVVNGSRSWLRRRVVARRNPPEPPATRESAEGDVLLGLEQHDLVAALRTLPRRQREVLVLRYYEGLSEARIADLLGCSSGSVKTHASRGLRALAVRLGERP